ncbi:MAG: hypothetical protein H6978_01755 [Gammaproteobacteria bacterium]|nr:hypothetical protein [Gammaproteobacteria bacterium]
MMLPLPPRRPVGVSVTRAAAGDNAGAGQHHCAREFESRLPGCSNLQAFGFHGAVLDQQVAVG